MAILTSITITPSNPFKLVSTTQMFTLTAHYSDAADDATIGIDPTTAWASSDTAVATINNSAGPTKGLATILTISGSTTITATYGGFNATTVLRVGLANYSRIIEPTVEGDRVGEADPANAPISRLTVSNISAYTGGVVFVNSLASAGGPIGYTVVSGHPNNSIYIANDVQSAGDWVQVNSSGNTTKTFSGSQRNAGVVGSMSVDISGVQLLTGGNPVFIQTSGPAYVFATAPINIGDFLGPDSNGKVKQILFDPATPTPILGYALEGHGETFSGMVLMQIQICGE